MKTKMPCFAAHQKTIFMVRAEIMKALLNDPEWRERLNKGGNSADLQKIVTEYAQQHGWKVVEI